MKFEMNEAEKNTFEKIKDGQTEFLFNKRNHNESKEEIESVFFLKNFGFVNGDVYSDEEKIGHINVSLTELGRHHSMSEEEIKKEISEKLKKLFEEN